MRTLLILLVAVLARPAFSWTGTGALLRRPTTTTTSTTTSTTTTSTTTTTAAGTTTTTTTTTSTTTTSSPPPSCSLITSSNNHNNADANSYTTASITPTGNDLVLAVVLNTKCGLPDTPTLTGNSLTYTQVDTVTWDDGGTSCAGSTPVQYRLTLFRALAASPTAGAITIDFGGVTQTGANWVADECSGVDTSGTNGANAIRQPTHTTATSTSSFTNTLAAFAKSNNGTWGANAQAATSAATPGSGFSELSDVQGASPANGLETEWKNSNDTTVDATSLSTTNWGGIALEVVSP